MAGSCDEKVNEGLLSATTTPVFIAIFITLSQSKKTRQVKEVFTQCPLKARGAFVA